MAQSARSISPVASGKPTFEKASKAESLRTFLENEENHDEIFQKLVKANRLPTYSRARIAEALSKYAEPEEASPANG